MKYIAQALKDYDGNEYVTILFELFDTEKEAKSALKNIRADVKHIKPITYNKHH